jgi:hypothetical protein
MMHGRGKSSPVIVARKPANKADPETVSAAESVERRALAIELNRNELELAMPTIGNAMAGGNLLPPKNNQQESNARL